MTRLIITTAFVLAFASLWQADAGAAPDYFFPPFYA